MRTLKTLKSTKLISTAALAAVLATTINALAIEGLVLSVQSSNVVLHWPSIQNETYIVQYRQSLQTNTPWQFLASALPAATGTNVTYFVHSNVVLNVNSCGSASMAVQPDNPPPLPLEGVPLAAKADGTGSAAPLSLYPPGFDFTDFLVFDPASASWVQASAYPMGSASTAISFPPGPGEGGYSTNGEPKSLAETGFYRVVRIGPHLFGFTNGMVLSGQVPLPIEWGNTNTPAALDLIFLFTTNETPLPAGITLPVASGDLTAGLNGTWDTTVTTNGVYTFGIAAYLNDYVFSQTDMSVTEYDDNPITVVVSNVISFDPYQAGGDAFYVGAKTLYTNGTWTMKIYDSQNHLLATLPTALTGLPGPIDGNGYCAWPDPNNPTQPDPAAPYPGFSLSNLDPNGNRLPYPSYTLVVTASALGGASSKTGTNVVPIEAPWAELPWASTSVVAYKQLFQDPSISYSEELSLIQAVASAQNIYHTLILGSTDVPWEIGGGWTPVTNALATAGNRDFFYFGHGSPNSLANGALTSTVVAALLGNNAVTTNSHPYRFVFLDGCETGSGNFPQAFGIPKTENMTDSDFVQKRGLRSRAFMGWNKTKYISLFGAYWNDQHSSLIAGFYTAWMDRNPVTGYGLRGVRAAFDTAASTNSYSQGMKIYGSKELIIDY